MASDESMTVVSSIQGDELDDIDVGFDHDHQVHPHNLSRLSMFSSSMYEDDDDVDDHQMGMYMSRFDADVDDHDEAFLDKKSQDEVSSDESDKEPDCHQSEGGVVVITRPKGGRRSLCMDLEEVKACRELGFELEHEVMLEMPSAGGVYPMSNWRISNPGDDPRDVKARLKVWAQAVALASSSSRHCI